MAGYRALIGQDNDDKQEQVSLHVAAITVAVMEDHWAFNAGYGSVLNEVWAIHK